MNFKLRKMVVYVYYEHYFIHIEFIVLLHVIDLRFFGAFTASFFPAFLPSFLRLSAILKRNLPPHTWEVSLICFRHLVGRLWRNDQPVVKASIYPEQHNKERRGQISMP
jgi:hypothetical protein